MNRCRTVTLAASLVVATVLSPISLIAQRALAVPDTNDNAAQLHDSLFTGYHDVSPHWQHIRTMMTDFYYKWNPNERRWAGRHYDYAMSGNIRAWKAENPAVQHYKYVLLQATTLPKTGGDGSLTNSWSYDMSRWYARHPEFHSESAFLHIVGQPADSLHRLRPWGWSTYTWIIDPADSGIAEYSIDRLQRAVEGEDGLFIDAQGSGDLLKNIKGCAEYPSESRWPPEYGRYARAYARLLARIKHALGAKVVIINSGPYRFAPDSASVLAAGATHMEKSNNPMSTDLPETWSFIDEVVAGGAFVDFVNSRDYADMKDLVRNHYATDEASAYWRMKMAELASYYMVVPKSPDKIALQLVSMWDRPYPPLWLRAQEANIGHPLGPRRTVSSNIAKTDPAGQHVKVFEREFERALVLIRVQTGYGTQSYSDGTSITVPLPSTAVWLPLHADGTLGAPVTSVELRNADAAIVVKRGTIS